MSLLLRWGFTVLRLFLVLQEKIINKIQEKENGRQVSPGL